MTLKELSDYKKNLDELKQFRALGLSPYQMSLIIEGAKAMEKELRVYHHHGIFPDNVHLFQKMDILEPAPLPLNLNGECCALCQNDWDTQGGWNCNDCNMKG